MEALGRPCVKSVASAWKPLENAGRHREALGARPRTPARAPLCKVSVGLWKSSEGLGSTWKALGSPSKVLEGAARIPWAPLEGLGRLRNALCQPWKANESRADGRHSLSHQARPQHWRGTAPELRISSYPSAAEELLAMHPTKLPPTIPASSATAQQLPNNCSGIRGSGQSWPTRRAMLANIGEKL